jgi:hypothetical protein
MGGFCNKCKLSNGFRDHFIGDGYMGFLTSSSNMNRAPLEIVVRVHVTVFRPFAPKVSKAVRLKLWIGNSKTLCLSAVLTFASCCTLYQKFMQRSQHPFKRLLFDFVTQVIELACTNVS